MLKRLILSVALLASSIGFGCSNHVDPAVYAAQTPAFDMRGYFNGTIDAWGVFQDRSGEVKKRFTVVMKCVWQGDVGSFEEDFAYADGTQQKRTWTFTRNADGSYTGRAPDVVGTATGILSGNALQLRYTLKLPVDGREFEVDFDDWLFQMDKEVVLNRAQMSKFGFNLGSLTVSFRKRAG